MMGSPRPKPSNKLLDAMIEEATIDAYNDEEQITGLFTMLEEHLALPFQTSVLGVTATVTKIDLTTGNEIVAICRRDNHKQAIAVLELPLPHPAPDGADGSRPTAAGAAEPGDKLGSRRQRSRSNMTNGSRGGRARRSTSSSQRREPCLLLQQLLDAAGRHRSPATLPEFHAGRAPGNKGQRYAADPPTVDEIIAVMRHARHVRYGNRLNGLIVVLWRAGLRINEALSLTETDLEERRGSILVRHGKNDRRRQVGMDAWGWTALGPWLSERATLPVGPLFCVIAGPTRGHAWSASAARLQLHQIALEAGVRRRFAPHQLRHAHAVELLREGVPLPLIQRQLGHSHLSTTGTYLQGISSEEIISTVHARRAPMMHASAGLAL